MGLFGKQPKHETSYQEVVDYLRDLTYHDYNKIIKVVTIYREADKGVKKVLRIRDTWSEVWTKQEADTELGNFLDDEPQKKVVIKKTPKPKAKKGKGEN